MQDRHAVFQPSYARLIRLRIFWSLPSRDSESLVSAVAVSAAPLVHPSTRVIDGGAHASDVPPHGTGFKILFHPAGAPGWPGLTDLYPQAGS